jgi:hypothetical protein
MPEDTSGTPAQGQTGLWSRTGITHRPRLLATNGNLATDFGTLRAGDLILCHAGTSPASRAVRQCQAALGIPEKARLITHVALCEGPASAIHAVPGIGRQGGVTRVDLTEFLPGQTVTIVSALDRTAEAERAAVVAAARNLIGQPYSLRLASIAAAAALLPEAWKGVTVPRAADALRTGQVCSTLVFEAYLAALGRASPLDPGRADWSAPYILPAYFYWNPNLRDVPPGPMPG